MWEVKVTPSVKVNHSVSHQQSLVCSHLHEPWIDRVLNTSISFPWFKTLTYEFTAEGERVSCDSLVCLTSNIPGNRLLGSTHSMQREAQWRGFYLHSSLSTALKQPQGQSSSQSYVQSWLSICEGFWAAMKQSLWLKYILGSCTCHLSTITQK